MKVTCISLALALGIVPSAWAGNVAHCEAVIMETLPADDGGGEAQIASYRPAVNFLASLYDEDDGHLTEIDGFRIRAIMCRRNDVIPSQTDYDILATGLPFILSQDFDSPDTDSLTIFWKDGALDYVYKGHPLSDESQSILDARLSKFSVRGKLNTPEKQVASVEKKAENLFDEAANADTPLQGLDAANTADLKLAEENQE